MSGFHLVIFDCDGVLVDSEALASRVWCEFLSEYDVHITETQMGQEYAGLTDGALAEVISNKYGIAFEGNVPSQIENRANIIFDKELKAIEGVAEVIAKAGNPRCVCTNSGHRRLISSLKLVGLLDMFDPEHLFSARMVEKPKPAPNLHLFAASQMGVSPEKCLVIEDSVTGVTAGVAAGMTVYGFTGASHLGLGHADKLLTAGAAQVFTHMTEIERLFS